MIKPTVQIGNPIIRKKSKKITDFSNSKVQTPTEFTEKQHNTGRRQNTPTKTKIQTKAKSREIY